MKFKDAVFEIVKSNNNGITPPEIQKSIEVMYPELYGTDSHIKNVEKGHYTDLHHALKAQVYSLVKRSDDFYCDKSVKPLLVSIFSNDIEKEMPEPEDLESIIGKVYVLKTGTFTKYGDEIIKIGHTTKSVENRMSQLYTTGVPFQFNIYKIYEVEDYEELESAIHKLLAKYRLNKSREFFSEKAVPFIDEIVKIHNAIHSS